MAAAGGQFDVIIAATDRVTAVVGRINEHIKHLQEPIAKVNHHFATLGSTVHELAETTGIVRFGERFGELGEKMRRVGEIGREILGPLAALGAAGSAAGLVELALHAAESAERIHAAAIKLGISAEEVQQVDFVAKMSGVDPGQMESGIAKFEKMIGQASFGQNKRVASLFKTKAFHIDLKSGGALRGVTDLLPEVADRLSKVAGEERRAAIVTALFGKSGMDLLPVLMKGSAAIKEEMENLKKHGQLSNKQVEEGAKVAESYNAMKQSITGVTNEIGAALFPTLDKYLKLAGDWLDKHRTIISQHLERAIHEIGEELKGIDWVTIIKSTESAVKTAINWTREVLGFKGVMVAIVAFLGAPLLSAIASVDLALMSLGVACPLLTVLSLLILGTIELYRNWDAIKKSVHEYGTMIATSFMSGKGLENGGRGAPRNRDGSIAYKDRYFDPTDYSLKGGNDSNYIDMLRRYQGVGGTGQKSETAISIMLSGLPAGARVTSKSVGPVMPKVDLGYAFGDMYKPALP